MAESQLRHGKKLCDAVYALHEPDVLPDVEVVFIHGLQRDHGKDAYWSTWLADDGSKDNCWPATWLKASFPRARILSLCYDASAWTTETTGRMDMYASGESLLSQMLLPDVGIGQSNRPVVFVCHSLGGLVAKQIVIMAHRQGYNVLAQNLLRNMKGLYFYGTPHGGSRLVDLASKLPFVRASPLVGYLKVLNKDMGRLNAEFEQIQREVYMNKWRFFVVAELHETRVGPFKGMVVEEASARLIGYPLIHVAGDHFATCKPKDLTATSFQHLKSFLNDIVTWHYKHIRAGLPRVSLYVVGMDVKESMLDAKLEEVSVVGLVGVGGIGKTTLSKTWYNSRSRYFERYCYLEDVKSKPLDFVQKQLLKDVCDVRLGNHEGVENHHLEEIRDCMMRRKVLVVVDDIPPKWESLEFLGIPNLKCGLVESKVIVTCRNWQDMHVFVPCVGRMDIGVLEYNHALELFKFHAFGEDEECRASLSFLEEHCEKIVKACSGLPLSIEVMGAYVSSKIDLSRRGWTTRMWNEALGRLRKAEAVGGGGENDRLWSKLRVSVDDLEEVERSRFLDIACYFCDALEPYSTVGYLNYVWGSTIELENLKERSLITEDFDGYVRMHDQLRDLGRKIVTERVKDTYKSHCWEKKEIEEMIVSNKILTNIEVLSWVPWNFRLGSKQSSSSAGRFPHLRLLALFHCMSPVLEYCLAQSPRRLTWLCLRRAYITKLPTTISSCENLRFLDLTFCENLKELPESIGELSELLALNLSHCSRLARLPESMGGLKALQCLHFSHCSSLEYLPQGVGQLPSLKYLELEFCEGLQTLCEFEYMLDNFDEELDLSSLRNLQNLPNSLGNLYPRLERLVLGKCKRLVQAPSLVQLPHLTLLDVEGIPTESAVWNALEGGHPQLRELRGVSGVPRNDAALRLGPNNFPALEYILLDVVKLQETLPAFLWQCTQLRQLTIRGAIIYFRRRVSHGLKEIHVGLGNLLNLEELVLTDLQGLERLPETLGCLSHLRTLSVLRCPALVELPQSTGRLSHLSELYLGDCHRLEWTRPSQISVFHELQKHGCSVIQLPDGRKYHGKYSSAYCTSGRARCVGCGLDPIPAKCWHCDLCPAFDLFEACYEQRECREWDEHHADHPITAIPVEVLPEP